MPFLVARLPFSSDEFFTLFGGLQSCRLAGSPARIRARSRHGVPRSETGSSERP